MRPDVVRPAEASGQETADWDVSCLATSSLVLWNHFYVAHISQMRSNKKLKNWIIIGKETQG